jgi:transcriptional antiterminator NusG
MNPEEEQISEQQSQPTTEEQIVEFKKGRQDPSQGRNWYAIHTYSGYEDTVEKSLRQRIETMNMQDKIFNVLVPKETEIILRKGKPVQRKKCIFPGYVLVDMIVTDDSWYVVRNTPNVTGFVGSGTTPVPVTPEEFGIVKEQMGTEEPRFKADFSKGDIVKIIDGPFATFEGAVDNVNEEKGKLRILVTIFDRETPVELSFDQVKKK